MINMNKHDTVTRSLWNFQTWNPDEIKFGKNLIKELDELNTTKQVKPIQDIKALNIITTAGLTEMAKRNIGTSSSSNTHHAVGIGTRIEDLSDTTLQSQVGSRKSIQTKSEYAGSERYATAFSLSNVGNQPRDIAEAGIYTAASGGILMMRVTTDQPAEISSGSILTVSTTIQHVNGTQV